jgi:MSHA pilin protein MshD
MGESRRPRRGANRALPVTHCLLPIARCPLRTAHCRLPVAAARRQRAFTLIEAVLSIVVVGIMATAALATLGASARAQLVQNDRAKALALASRFLSEIVQQRFAEPAGIVQFGREAGEDTSVRALWDDVDDYHGLNISPPTDATGVALSGYTKWRVTVTIDFVDPATLASNGETDNGAGLKRITVTVLDPRERQTVLVSLRSSVGLYERLPTTAMTYINWIGIDMQAGSSPAGRIGTGINPLNQVP